VKSKTQFIVRLQALSGFGWSTSPEQRLRGLLKVALRRFGFRCVACRPDEKAAADSIDANQLGRPATGQKAISSRRGNRCIVPGMEKEKPPIRTLEGPTFFDTIKSTVRQVLTAGGAKKFEKPTMKISEIRSALNGVESQLRQKLGDGPVDDALGAAGWIVGKDSDNHASGITKRSKAFSRLVGLVPNSHSNAEKLKAIPATAAETPTQRNNPPMQNPQTPTTAGEPSTESLQALAEVLFGENDICRQMGAASNRNDQRAALVKRFFIEGLEVPNLSFHGVRTHPSDMPKLSAAGHRRKIAQAMIAEFFAALDGNATFESQERPATKKALALVHKQHGMKSNFYSGFIGLKPGQRYDHAKAEGTPVSELKTVPKWEVGEGGPSLSVWEAEQRAKALRQQFAKVS